MQSADPKGHKTDGKAEEEEALFEPPFWSKARGRFSAVLCVSRASLVCLIKPFLFTVQGSGDLRQADRRVRTEGVLTVEVEDLTLLLAAPWRAARGGREESASQ